ncbi:MAG: SufS family cysteine desulfurase [Pseudomonadales bacterium]
MNRADFPILETQLEGGPLVYLDNAATTQKPRAVLDAMDDYYRTSNANVHRAAHALADRATRAFEAARDSAARFINAAAREEVIFTSGTTAAINLVASVHRTKLRPGDQILISEAEHHSNIVPWQLLAEATGATLIAAAVTDRGEIDRDDYRRKLEQAPVIVALQHVSNALGSVHPVGEMIREAHDAGAVVLIDGAQALAHLPVDVQALDCDFYAGSAHKMYGPTGVGILYGKRALLEALPPWQGGGEMIEHVTIERSVYNALPYKFEAGTPNIAGVVGFGAAIEYLAAQDWTTIREHEQSLIEQTLSQLRQMPGVRLVGEPAERAAAISFLVDGSHPHDIGMLLDQQGVAVRTGHHCAMPLMQRLSIPGTVRASYGLYNSTEDVDQFVTALRKALTFV